MTGAAGRVGPDDQVAPAGTTPAPRPFAVGVDLPTPEVALAVGAHPDDIEFQCGATLAKWAAAGCVVHHLVLTDGSKGTWDPHADTVALAARRVLEQVAAARALGAVGEVVVLDHPDGELSSGLAGRREVVTWIRRLAPQVVLGHDPWKRYRLHPDHRHAGWLTVDGLVAARDPHFDPDLGPHHRPDALLLFEADEPDHVEEVSGFGEAKLAALLEHRSQYRSTMHIDPDDDGTQLEAFRRWVFDRLAQGAAVAGGPEAGVVEAEVFKAVTRL
jgi:LmbE family N-acetylglucosaminyl deacetylase